MIPGFFTKIEEELIHLPGTNLKISLAINTTVRDRNGSSSPCMSTYNMNNGGKILNVKTSDFLVFKYFGLNKDDNEFIYVSYFNYQHMLVGFRAAYKMLQNAYEETDDGGLVISIENKRGVSIDRLVNNKSIGIKPTVVESSGGAFSAGVQIFLNSETKMCTLSYEDFVQTLYFLEKFDLYSASKMLLNSAMMYHNFSANRKSAESPIKKKRNNEEDI